MVCCSESSHAPVIIPKSHVLVQDEKFRELFPNKSIVGMAKRYKVPLCRAGMSLFISPSSTEQLQFYPIAETSSMPAASYHFENVKQYAIDWERGGK